MVELIYPVPFQAEHYEAVAIHDAQAWLARYATVGSLRTLEGPYSGTLMRDGKPLVCGGVVPMWENRALAWCFFDGRFCPREFRTIHGYAKAFLDALPFRRVEAAVVVDFEAGHRWVKALGFACETPPPARMRAFQADGADCLLYARVKEG